MQPLGAPAGSGNLRGSPLLPFPERLPFIPRNSNKEPFQPPSPPWQCRKHAKHSEQEAFSAGPKRRVCLRMPNSSVKVGGDAAESCEGTRSRQPEVLPVSAHRLMIFDHNVKFCILIQRNPFQVPLKPLRGIQKGDKRLLELSRTHGPVSTTRLTIVSRATLLMLRD